MITGLRTEGSVRLGCRNREPCGFQRALHPPSKSPDARSVLFWNRRSCGKRWRFLDHHPSFHRQNKYHYYEDPHVQEHSPDLPGQLRQPRRHNPTNLTAIVRGFWKCVPRCPCATQLVGADQNDPRSCPRNAKDRPSPVNSQWRQSRILRLCHSGLAMAGSGLRDHPWPVPRHDRDGVPERSSTRLRHSS